MRQTFLCVLLFAIQMVAAGVGNPGKTQRIEGIVVDLSNSESLTGVRVSVEGTETITMTDENGFFQIDIPIGTQPTLIFELVSFEKVLISQPLIEGKLTVAMNEIP